MYPKITFLIITKDKVKYNRAKREKRRRRQLIYETRQVLVSIYAAQSNVRSMVLDVLPLRLFLPIENKRVWTSLNGISNVAGKRRGKRREGISLRAERL